MDVNVKEQVNIEGSMSNDIDINVTKEATNLENEGVDMAVEYASGSHNGNSGLNEDNFSDGCMDKMVILCCSFFL